MGGGDGWGGNSSKCIFFTKNPNLKKNKTFFLVYVLGRGGGG